MVVIVEDAHIQEERDVVDRIHVQNRAQSLVQNRAQSLAVAHQFVVQHVAKVTIKHATSNILASPQHTKKR